MRNSCPARIGEYRRTRPAEPIRFTSEGEYAPTQRLVAGKSARPTRARRSPGILATPFVQARGHLEQAIRDYLNRHNADPQPFVWTATADSILAKIERLCDRISGTAH